MVHTLKAFLSARHHEAVLFLVQAEDAVLNLPFDVPPLQATQAILRHANMNDTGRMPGVALLHVGMEVRLTVTVEPPHCVVDCTGTILGFDLHPEDSAEATSAAEHGRPLCFLRRLPHTVLVKLDDCDNTLLPPLPCALHEATGAAYNADGASEHGDSQCR